MGSAEPAVPLGVSCGHGKGLGLQLLPVQLVLQGKTFPYRCLDGLGLTLMCLLCLQPHFGLTGPVSVLQSHRSFMGREVLVRSLSSVWVTGLGCVKGLQSMREAGETAVQGQNHCAEGKGESPGVEPGGNRLEGEERGKEAEAEGRLGDWWAFFFF